jgi:peptidoglycan/xylan/chitin deacetylase (PgdA/CDA1 family)
VTILCYHAVEPGWTAPLSMEPPAFARHCEYLARHRTVIPLRDAVDRLDRSGRLPRGLASLTFDDGFRGLQEHAMPALRRHSLPSTVFLVAQTLTAAGQAVDWVDNPAGKAMHTLDIDQVRAMQDEGVSFESHSWSHADLTTLDHAECVRDLRDSRELLESVLERPVRLLAYPRGRHDEQVRAAAREAGYSHAFTLPEGPEEVGPYSIPRVGLYHGNDVRSLRLKAARPYLPLRTSRVYQLARERRASAARPLQAGRS